METTETLTLDDGGWSASLDHALSAHLFHSALCLADMNLMLARRRFTTTPEAWAMPSTLSATSSMGFQHLHVDIKARVSSFRISNPEGGNSGLNVFFFKNKK